MAESWLKVRALASSHRISKKCQLVLLITFYEQHVHFHRENKRRQTHELPCHQKSSGERFFMAMTMVSLRCSCGAVPLTFYLRSLHRGRINYRSE